MARRVWLGVLVVGLGLMAMMIVVEGEPGLLPLLLVVGGSAGYGVARWRERGKTRR